MLRTYLVLLCFNIMGCSLFFADISSVDYDASEGTPLRNFTSSWTLDANTSGSYSISSGLKFESTHLGMQSINSDYNNNNTLGFGARLNATNVTWSTDGMTLDGAQTGSFESRIFNAGSPISWTQLDWISASPAGKELPNNAGTEAGYSTGAANMSDNILLYHFNEASWSGAPGEIIDSSGATNHGSLAGSPTQTSTGKFGSAILLDDSSKYVSVPAPSGVANSSHLTIEAWVKLPVVDTWQTIVSQRVDENEPNYGFSLFVGDILGTPSIVVDIGGSDESLEGGRSRIGLSSFPTNQWVHLAATYDSTLSPSGGSVRVFVNGEFISDAQGAKPSIPASSANLVIGALPSSGGTFGLPLKGEMDELAIFKRTLSDSEIRDHYLRGAHRIKLQQRACANSNCSDGVYGGTFLTELLNTGLTSTTSSPLALASRQYFQYKVTLESDDALTAPKLKQVSVAPTLYEANSTVISLTGIIYKRLSGFSTVESGPTIRYQLSTDGQHWFYWNGSRWVAASNSYAQATPAAQVNSNIASFSSINGIGSIFFKAFFSSGNGSQVGTLSSVTLSGKR